MDPGGGTDEGADRSGRQAGQAQVLEGRLAGKLPDGGRQRVFGGQLDVAVGPDDEERHVAQLSRHEPQEKDGRCVSGVEIVEDDQEWLHAA